MKFDLEKLSEICNSQDLHYSIRVKNQESMKLDPVLNKYDYAIMMTCLEVDNFTLTALGTEKIKELYMNELEKEDYSLEETPILYTLNTFFLFIFDSIYDPELEDNPHVCATLDRLNNSNIGLYAVMNRFKNDDDKEKYIASLMILDIPIDENTDLKENENHIIGQVNIYLNDEYAPPFLATLIESTIMNGYMHKPEFIQNTETMFIEILDLIRNTIGKKEIKKTDMVVSTNTPKKHKPMVFLYQ